MRNIFLSAAVLYFLSLSLAYPFVAGMAYLWIDIVKPQALAYSFITALPLSLIAALFVLISYTFYGEKNSFKLGAVQLLILVFALWITLTTYLADPLLNSWAKWDPSFKALIFTIIIPLLFRSRMQIEALVATILFSLATIVFSGGVKTLLGGGGYGVLAVLGGANTGLAESSTLSAVALMMLPLIHFIYKQSVIFPKNWIFKGLLLSLAVTAIAAVVGSTARTGLVAGAFLLLCYALRSNRKFLWGIVFVVIAAVGGTLDLEGTTWGQRMSTINTYSEDASATGRIDVWTWTLKFVARHPMGGGFDAYRFNGIATPRPATDVDILRPTVIGGKAFHSVYFEVLGEQGIFGFLLYLSIMALTFLNLKKIKRSVKGKPELQWAAQLAANAIDAQAVLLVAGLFIGIAFQPVMFYLVAVTICLNNVIFKRPLIKMTDRPNAKRTAKA